MQEYLHQTADAVFSLSDSGCRSISIRQRMQYFLYQTADAVRQRMQEFLNQTADAGETLFQTADAGDSQSDS